MNQQGRKYCRKCILYEDVPGIKIMKNGQCNICNGTFMYNSSRKYKNLVKASLEFEYYITHMHNNYNCIIMLSGGKDSIYILKKFVERKDIRFLAFTLKHPYMPKDDISNIDKANSIFEYDHVYYKLNSELYTEMIQHLLYSNEFVSSNIFDCNRILCHSCVCFTIIHTYIYAFKKGIKFIMYCSDLNQMTLMDLDIKFLIKTFKSMYQDKIYKFFDKDILQEILQTDSKYLPILMSPYSNMYKYDKDKIIDEVKSIGLYIEDSPTKRCEIFPLAHCYSIKKHNLYYRILMLADDVRNGRRDRKKIIEFIEGYNENIRNLIEKDELSQNDKSIVKNIFSKAYNPHEFQFLYECDNILFSMKKVADEWNIDLNKV